MKASLRYAATGSLALGSVILALWWFLGPPARHGVLLAAAIALAVQVVAFALLERCKTRVKRFVAVWAGGTVVRMAVVVGTAFLVLRAHMPGAVVLVFALVGFLFLLLLLEPLYFRLQLADTTKAR